jgi:hypothetical protein
MNLKRMLGGTLAIAMLLLSACGDDDKVTPKSQFDYEGDAVTLKDANLYLAYDEDNDGNGHMYREYFITDGTYDAGDPWDVSDYIDATYVIALQIGGPMEDELAKGSYPLYESFSDAPETSNISWVSFDTSTAYYYTPDDAMGEEAIQLSGSFDDGDMMTIKYNGPLEFSDDATDEDIDGKLYFKGEVQDVRIAAPARKPAPVAKGGVK